jgi:hypothetical protein
MVTFFNFSVSPNLTSPKCVISCHLKIANFEFKIILYLPACSKQRKIKIFPFRTKIKVETSQIEAKSENKNPGIFRNLKNIYFPKSFLITFTPNYRLRNYFLRNYFNEINSVQNSGMYNFSRRIKFRGYFP